MESALIVSLRRGTEGGCRAVAIAVSTEQWEVASETSGDRRRGRAIATPSSGRPSSSRHCHDVAAKRQEVRKAVVVAPPPRHRHDVTAKRQEVAVEKRETVAIARRGRQR